MHHFDLFCRITTANKNACSLTGNLRFIFNTILIITGEKIQDGITREYKLYATTRGYDERQSGRKCACLYKNNVLTAYFK